ncbi:NAD(P)-binding domain-containing protein [Candidatus Woesearchaeota archaeon]|nr:NAD(P)-binding domain-containing protein [Candidatus Woesearchaeota archaeon]
MTSVFIIGAGSFGTALAQVWSKTLDVTIYGNNNKVIYEINNKKTNEKYLSGIKLHKNIVATNNLSEVKQSKIIILAIPSYAVKEVLKN